MARFIDNYDVILLDMGKTFMFDCDRFDDPACLQRTYEQLGGRELSNGRAAQIALDAFRWGMELYRSDPRPAQFPSTQEMLEHVPEAAGLAEDELQRLVEVIAAHEVGTIPPSHIAVLQELRRTHRMGLVSNIFSPSDIYRKAFVCAGITALFDVLAWSSDVGVCKPWPGIFEHALKAFAGVARKRIVHIGDNLQADVGGACGVGIDAVWISLSRTPPDEHEYRPNLVIETLPAILSC